MCPRLFSTCELDRSSVLRHHVKCAAHVPPQHTHTHGTMWRRYDAFVQAGVAGMRATQVTHRWQGTLTELSETRAEQNKLLAQVMKTAAPDPSDVDKDETGSVRLTGSGSDSDGSGSPAAASTDDSSTITQMIAGPDGKVTALSGGSRPVSTRGKSRAQQSLLHRIRSRGRVASSSRLSEEDTRRWGQLNDLEAELSQRLREEREDAHPFLEAASKAMSNAIKQDAALMRGGASLTSFSAHAAEAGAQAERASHSGSPGARPFRAPSPPRPDSGASYEPSGAAKPLWETPHGVIAVDVVRTYGPDDQHSEASDDEAATDNDSSDNDGDGASEDAYVVVTSDDVSMHISDKGPPHPGPAAMHRAAEPRSVAPARFLRCFRQLLARCARTGRGRSA